MPLRSICGHSVFPAGLRPAPFLRTNPAFVGLSYYGSPTVDVVINGAHRQGGGKIHSRSLVHFVVNIILRKFPKSFPNFSENILPCKNLAQSKIAHF